MSKPFVLEFEFRNQRFQDAEKGLRYFADRLGENITRAGPVLSKELRVFLEGVAEALARRHGNPWPGGTTTSTLSRRSGKLISAIKQGVEVTGTRIDDIEGRLAVKGIPYARIQETGGVIRAKNAQYLTIPLPAALNPDGTPKKRRARDWDRTFIKRSKSGNLLIFRKVGDKIEPLYVLKKSVRIPARLGMRQTLEAGLPYFVDKAMQAMVRELTNV